MKIKVTDDGTLLYFELLPQTNVDKMWLECLGTAQSATIRRNGTATFTVEIPRTEVGKYSSVKGEPDDT